MGFRACEESTKRLEHLVVREHSRAANGISKLEVEIRSSVIYTVIPKESARVVERRR